MCVCLYVCEERREKGEGEEREGCTMCALCRASLHDMVVTEAVCGSWTGWLCSKYQN